MDKRDFLKAAVLPIVAQSAAVLSPAAFAQQAPESGATRRVVEANGIRIGIMEQGSGPLVLLCHGFPETSYSWRHQLPALAAAGFHAVAPDMRGYGKSDRPEAVDQYSIFHIIGDLVGVMDALGAKNAVVVGHDVGAAVAWQMAQLRPDRVRAMAALSVPFRPRSPARPTTVMPRTADAQFYMLYFQQPGPAEAEFESDVRASVRNMLFGASGDGVAASRAAAAANGGQGTNLSMVPNGGRFMRGSGAPEKLPAWVTEADVDAYANDFRQTGFRGALNYYRNLDRNWEIQGALVGAQVTVPVMYMAGDRDFIVGAPGMDQAIANMKQLVPGLRKVQMIPGAGHWTQQERPAEVNAALLEFLRGLPA
jgi:pimeloyl-ACP methyl ester carboxylesterase